MNPAVVLYVDDSEVDRLLVHHAWRRGAPAVILHMVADGEAAMSYLSGTGPFTDRAACPLPTIMLLDLKLPGLSGLEVLRWVRTQSQLQDLPVVMLTASYDPADVRAAEAAGADFYLTKPADLKRLQHIAQTILAAHAQSPPDFAALGELVECIRAWLRH